MEIDKNKSVQIIKHTELKVLWFSNIAISNQEMNATGTWIYAMSLALHEYHPEIKIYNITKGRVKHIIHEKVKDVEQWVLPINVNDENNIVFNIIGNIKPTLIHIWGTEASWGNIPFQQKVPTIPILLDMQGFMKSVYENYYGDLSLSEVIKCFSIKELIKPKSSLPAYKRIYKLRALREKLIINKFNYISTQSDWMTACIKSINSNCRIYNTKIALRDQFYKASPWKFNSLEQHHPIIFTTASVTNPLKGLTVLLKTFNIILAKYPNAELFIAGNTPSGIRESGYSKFIKRYIKTHKMSGRIKFLGALSTDKLIYHYQHCSVFVNPSLIESYSLVVAEAMILGVPVVASYAGAICELGVDGESILFFPKADYIVCASKILKLIDSPDFALKISTTARQTGLDRNNRKKVADRQYEIYNNILSTN